MATVEGKSSAATGQAASQAGTAAGPRIYAIDPALAGGPDGLAAWVDHAARLGFNHVLFPVPFPTLSGERDPLVTDETSLAPELGGGPAEAGIRRLAELARSRGLVPLLDLVLDRIAAAGPLAHSAGGIFAPPPAGEVLDPRHAVETGRAAVAPIHNVGDAGRLGEWWGTRIGSWHEAGIGGFRLLGLARLPAWALPRLLGTLREASPPSRLFGWTPGVDWNAFAELADSGLDGVFPSLPWWDWNADWLWDEMERLARVAPLIACPEAPEASPPPPPLVAPHHTPEQGLAAIRRAVTFAAGLGSGWMLPAGLEFGLFGRTPRSPGPPAKVGPTGPLDLCASIRAANAARQDDALRGDVPPRLATGPGAPVLALVRTGADPRVATRAALLVVNTDLERAHRIAASAVLAAAAGRFADFTPVVPEDGGHLSTGTDLTLAPGETRIYTAEAISPGTAAAAQPQGNREAAERAAREPRVAIEDVTPRVDGGLLLAVKRVVGETVIVEADVICDGHDQVSVAMQWRGPEHAEWQETRMRALGNDRYRASLPLTRMGRTEFTIQGWRDVFASFRDELRKKHAAGVPIHLELQEGQAHVAEAAARTSSAKSELGRVVQQLGGLDEEQKREILLSDATAALMATADERPFGVKTAPFAIEADRTAARFASWYEVFPRSMSDDPKRHGNFDDVIRHLPRVQAMGFDVLYFPPIHPIGKTNRKGRNNTLTPAPEDPGSPYAIGAEEGGHDAIHPELGTLEDFRRLIAAAHEHGLEIAIDFAIQCSPDHPWLKQHKEWFDWRPDGTIRYAENPPKKYEDIVNVDFYAPGAIPDLWLALCNVVLFWAQQGVRIFRVDNPHTKPLPFWHWMIGTVRSHYPDALFLAEAFTRPKVMYRLAKIGFTQSYTYFTWRNTKAELTEYLTELSTTAPRDFFRPNFFVNTPDINPIPLQTSGRPGYLIRAALAATLSGLWGVYNGFELTEGRALPGREEYADSEKYQIRAWDWNRPGNIVPEITALNRIRRMNPALQTHLGVTFLNAWNDNILFYEKATPDRSNVLLVAVSLDPHNVQACDIELPLGRWKLPDNAAVEATDLLHGSRVTWHGRYQHLRLTPDAPYAIWRAHLTA